MLAVLVATAAGRLITYIMKLLTDAAIAFGQGKAGIDEVWHWTLLFPAVYLANEAVWRTSGFCGMRWITGAVAEVNRRLFGHLSEHSATYFSDRYAGALVNKVANAANGTEQLISQWLWQFFPWIIGLAGGPRTSRTSPIPTSPSVLVGWTAGVRPAQRLLRLLALQAQLPVRRGLVRAARADGGQHLQHRHGAASGRGRVREGPHRRVRRPAARLSPARVVVVRVGAGDERRAPGRCSSCRCSGSGMHLIAGRGHQRGLPGHGDHGGPELSSSACSSSARP